MRETIVRVGAVLAAAGSIAVLPLSREEPNALTLMATAPIAGLLAVLAAGRPAVGKSPPWMLAIGALVLVLPPAALVVWFAFRHALPWRGGEAVRVVYRFWLFGAPTFFVTTFVARVTQRDAANGR